MRETIHTFTSHNIDNHRLPQGCAKVKKKRSTINQRVCITRPLQKKKKKKKLCLINRGTNRINNKNPREASKYFSACVYAIVTDTCV